MRFGLNTFGLLALCTSAVTSVNVLDAANYEAQNIIRRDVAIIGGGSSGIYTGVRLRDNEHSIAIIESKPVIGGHAETYVDPATGTHINLGVVVFQNSSVVRGYFDRFNTGLVKMTSAPRDTLSVDFTTGKVITNFTYPSNQAVAKAFAAYEVQLQKSRLTTGGGFNLSYPIMPDLLLPFPDFVKKYRLGNFMQTLFSINQGYALTNISTIYMLKYLNQGELDEFKNGFFRSATGDTHSLYNAIQAEFASDIFLNSSILAMNRSSPNQVQISIQSGNTKKLIIAKKLVSCIPPMLSNLKGYDLSTTETGLFKQFFANGYYTGVLRNTNIDQSLVALDPSQKWGLQQLPSPYTFEPNEGTNLTSLFFASPSPITAASAQRMIGQALNRYQRANNLTVTPPDFAAFSSHAPFNLMVSNDAIKNGFYSNLAALQGQRNTFYNGAFLEAQDSSAIWQYTSDVLLPKIRASL